MMSEALKDGELRLSTKPSAALHYSYMPGSDATDILVVFINGLMLPRVGWTPTINLIAEKSTTTRPAMLSYDRYGQGTSDADPADSMSPRGVHDLMDVVRDLDTFLSELGRLKMPDRCSWGQPGQYRLVFVCNSIGCPIARLFAQERPGGSSTVSAFVFLDSMMANTDFVSMFPDPDATDFKPDTLPQDLTVQDIRRARQVYKKFFHPSVPNQEHLDRSNAAQLLPYSDQPKLCGSDDRGPWLTVVGHDWDIFAAENKRSFDIPEAICREYVKPCWHRYNLGLGHLTEQGRLRGPVIAGGCGHFIQRDNPKFVAEEVLKILELLQDGS